MNLLAIETSCDETALAVFRDATLCANVVYSQIKKHKQFGGVVPELASRMHVEKIHPLLDQVLNESQLTLSDLDAVAVTYGPGLEGALLVGISVAKTLSYLLQIPLIPVNHLHGHIYTQFLEPQPPRFPFIALIASGGHTMLVRCDKNFSFNCLGETRDDAAGEAFDKVARLLDLGYPGGPIVESMAKQGDPKRIIFPKGLHQKGLEFSFSGLKTAVIQKIKSFKDTVPVADICAGFQDSVCSSLVSKSLAACKAHQISQLVLCGGVTANRSMLEVFKSACEVHNVALFSSPIHLCTDNAAMIGACALQQPRSTWIAPKDLSSLSASPNLAV